MPPDYKFTGVEGANNIIGEEIIEPSNLETIDYAFYDFVKEQIQVRTTTNKGWKEVPIIWASPERAFFSKEKKELADLDGTLIFPIMSIERSSVSKATTNKGALYGAPPNMIGKYYGGRIMISRRIVADKTTNFAAAQNIKRFGNSSNRVPNKQPYYPIKNNKKVVYETLLIPQPVFLNIGYNITLKSNYQQQMNQMIQPFISLGGHINSFLIKRSGHSYETFLKTDLSQNNNLSSYDSEEKLYETTISFDVLGYTIGEGLNQERPKIIKRENAVEVKIPRERVIVGDTFDYEVDSANSPFYRD